MLVFEKLAEKLIKKLDRWIINNRGLTKGIANPKIRLSEKLKLKNGREKAMNGQILRERKGKTNKMCRDMD